MRIKLPRTFYLSRMVNNGIANFSTAAAAQPQRKLFWRDSATLLIAKPSQDSTNVEFLMTQRAKHAKFMANGLCFPGGAVSDIDSSNEWYNLFKKFNQDDIINKFSWLEPGAHKPPIYELEDKHKLPRDISLRITAIRETFEECGILFCTSKNGQGEGVMDLAEKDVINWQSRVKKNPDDFLTMCFELQVLPNLYGLYEWNNWLTPIYYKPGPKGPRRFDTLFYMTILSNRTPPPIIVDPDEVEGFSWSSAEKLVEDHCKGIHQLMPPQLYEMGRLFGLRNTDELKKLIKTRQELGIERWCPHLRMASDGVFGCLPGDDLMPKNPNINEYEEMEEVNSTINELKKSSGNLHRWLIGKDGSYQVTANTYRYGHKYIDEDVSVPHLNFIVSTD